MNKTNSAKKLHYIFKDLAQRDGGMSINEVWSQLLGADLNNANDIIDKISQVFKLSNDLKEDINSLEIDPEEKSNFISAVDKIQLFMIRNDLQRIAQQSGTIMRIENR